MQLPESFIENLNNRKAPVLHFQRATQGLFLFERRLFADFLNGFDRPIRPVCRATTTAHKTRKPAQAANFQPSVRVLCMEQDTGLEPAAYCLGSSRSTG